MGRRYTASMIVPDTSSKSSAAVLARSVLLAAGLVELLAGVAVVVASMVRNPGGEGILGGLAGGVALALVIMAATRAALVQLRKDVACVLKAADEVIDLGHRFEVRG